ncbi:MAG: DAK2 domain-containing protein [Chloroflexi bacterium]|nr:DAK2 domain-containing protein [Chloroflexota bacterium]
MSDAALREEDHTAALTHCDGLLLRQMTKAAMTWLTTNQQIVNALNVFPVPDGDTGTNMLLTMQAACKEAAEKTDKGAGAIAHAIAHGALMGARGNSGVILSQVWRGFARALDDRESFDGRLFATAMREATETAYKGVVKPVEGTILTVSKDVAVAAEGAAGESDDLRYILECVVAAAHESVERTPDLLPVLKQAGVVDSGGKGLAIVLEGMLRYLRGESLDAAPVTPIKTLDLASIGAAMDAVEPGQEWEVVVDFRPKPELDLPYFYNRLDSMGTSIQVGSGEDLYRVHIHLVKEKRYEPIALAEDLGTVVNVHMENLIDQMEREKASKAPPPLPQVKIEPGQIAVVAVAPGQGLARVFASLGAVVVSGGQTMNPSTEEILNAIGDLPTHQVVVLPNNKNIVLAAQQARDLSVKHVAVVPTRTVPQGIAAMLALTPGGELDAVARAMTAAFQAIETGEITTATRDVELNGVTCRAGQIIGLHNGDLTVAAESVEATVLDLLKKMRAAERELITLYYGEPVTAADAAAQVEAIRARYPDQEIELVEGGQPHYHYIVSAE